MIKRTLSRARRKLTRSRPAMSRRDFGDISEIDRSIIDQVDPYTMTNVERILAVIDATRYCVQHDIPGAFAECGVWRGGLVLAMILVLQDEGVDDRDIWLYDTFEGMTLPTQHDVSVNGDSALEIWRKARRRNQRAFDHFFAEHVFNEEDVRRLLVSTGYPPERLHFVRGPVEKTVPDNLPATFSVLRLDTDWYESTKHEMEHMYPRLSEGGVLIVDDYGVWRGSKVAVDEYFARHDAPVLLTRIDHTGRLVVKRSVTR